MSGSEPPHDTTTSPGQPAFDIVVIGASAGGLQALTLILSHLPADLQATVVVLQHVDPQRRSHLAEILGRHTSLPVSEAQPGMRLRPGAVYIAKPGAHLLIDAHLRASLSGADPVHFVRPSVDLLFASVAERYGRRAIAVLLTGTGSDGATGVVAIKEHGGVVIVQDEASSAFFGMPGAAIATGAVDLVLPLDEIAGTVGRLVRDGRPA